jgi:dipeptidyl-peptidase-4
VLIFTNSRRVWRANTRGDYWVFDREASDSTEKLIKIGGDSPESTLMYAGFSPDGTRVAYVHANNLYVEELKSKKITQLTTDGSPDIINGTSDWVNEEELELRNCFRWSPDGRFIAYWQFDQANVGEYTLINDTASRYPTTEKYKYPLAGTTNSAVRAGVVPVEGGATRWLKLKGDPRNHYVARMEWEQNSHFLVLEYLDRLQKTNQYVVGNADDGETRVAFEDTDKAWVDVSPLHWIRKGDGGSDLLIESERDGWRHIYRLDLKEGQAKLVTNFSGDVIETDGVDQDAGWVYFTASPDDPRSKYLYRSRLDGSGTPERVTPRDKSGTHDFFFAPNGRWAFQYVSSIDVPSNIDLLEVSPYHVARTIEDNKELVAKVAPLLSSQTEFFKVRLKDNVTLDGWILKPPDFNPAKKYPVLFWVYGEPWFSTIRDQWFFSERIFHGLIAKEGYLVVSIDNAGTTSPRGREWRKSVYGAVGVLSSAQIAEAMRVAASEKPYIDTARMAIWGWSGGASNTLNLMFRYPDVFSTGIAVAPVPDQAGYDTIYQERYMGLPEENKSGYHDGSPINFAAGLKGNLLLIHGSGDDNVHFQGSEELVNRLIELGKPFDFMDYPNRSHGIYEGKGTSVHLRMLIVRYLEAHVPPGGVTR